MLTDRDEVLLFFIGFNIPNDNRSLATNCSSKIHNTINPRNLGSVLWFARLKKFRNPWKTAGYITGLGSLSWGLGNQAASHDSVALLDNDMSTGWNRVIGNDLSILVLNHHLRVQILLVINNHQ